jgi:hypothetical protein
MQPCCEPGGIGTARLDLSQSSAVDSRLSHGKLQQAVAVQAYSAFLTKGGIGAPMASAVARRSSIS